MQTNKTKGRNSIPLTPVKRLKKSRSFCDEKSKGVKERTPVNRTTFQVFELAPDAKLSEEHPKFLSRSAVSLTTFEKEEKKDSTFSLETKTTGPEIIITRCEQQVSIENPEGSKCKRKSLFEGFNEKCAERKKQIEEIKLHEQRLKEVSMDKYPFKSTKKIYKKSTFYDGSKVRVLDDENNDICE